jgi:uncharacterized protein
MIRRDSPPGQTSICIGCGLCCNGILHNHVDVDPDDESAVVAAGLPILREGSKRVFRQPCPKFSCGACSVYADRPAVCRTYRCKLLKNVDEGHLTIEEAGDKIATAKTLIGTVASAVPEGATSELRARAAKRLKENLGGMPHAEREGAARTLLDIGVLEHFLDRWFRIPKEVRKHPQGRAEKLR